MFTLHTSGRLTRRSAPASPDLLPGSCSRAGIRARHSFLASSTLAALLLLPALAQAAGPSIYNPQTDAMSVDFNFANGDEFRNVINAKELKVLGSDAQVKSVRIFLGSGKVLDASEDDTARLRHGIAQPRNQVWVVDGARICVMDIHKFKRKVGLKCPAEH